jgi:uncharacterized membrane protein YbhN (UPF0104 family)
MVQSTKLRAVQILLRLLSAAAGVCIILYLFGRIDLAGLAKVFHDAPMNAGLLAAVFVLLFFHYVFDGLCQYVLLDSRRIPLLVFVARVCQTQIFTLFLPGRIGELTLLLVMRGESRAKVFKTYVFTKFIFLSMLLAAAAPLLAEITHLRVECWLALSAVSFAAIAWACFNLQTVKALLLRLPVLPFRKKWEEIGVVSPSPRAFFLTVFLTAVRILLAGLLYYLLLMALGFPLPFWTVLPIHALVLMSGFIPITPMGLGVVEWIFTVLYARYGISPEAAISVPIVARAMQLVTLGIFALTLLTPLAPQLSAKPPSAPDEAPKAPAG